MWTTRLLIPQRPQQLASVIRRQLSSSTTTTNRRRRITYLTDVEGDAAYLNRHIENSKVLRFDDSSSKNMIDFSCPHAMLIYGGDVWDKGGSDLYVIRQLLHLKQKYPDRVHFIMGNRDINKMRISQELSSSHHDGVWWIRTTNKGRGNKPDPTGSKSERLKWILAHTMGSPNAFELRRSELKRERENNNNNNNNNNTIVSDEDVLQSYLDSCHAQTGEMGQYLSQAHLCFKLGKLLVMHGALPWMVPNQQQYDTTTRSNLATPWLSSNKEEEETAHYTNSYNGNNAINEWLNALSKFAQSQIQQWKLAADTKIPTNDVWSSKGGFDYWPASQQQQQQQDNTTTTMHSYAGLLQYGMGWLPTEERIPTVVYSSWTQSGMPRQFFSLGSSQEAESTTKFMNDLDVKVILSGHQPQGDLPTPIRLDDDKLILACDTSYSGDVQWFIANDNDNSSKATAVVGARGPVAVCEVLIDQCVETGTIESVTHHGVLSNGRSFESTNLMETTATVGRLATDDDAPDTTRDWWVKANFVDGSQLLTTSEGYGVVNSITSSRR